MSLPQPITPETGEAQLAQVMGVAMALSRAGRNDQALPILGQLARLHPGRSDVRLAHVAALGDQGHTLDALAQLSALKPMGVTPALMAAVQAQAEMAIAKFNAHLARGEPADAERFAAALAEVMPQNPAMLQAALSCNQALGRTAQAAHYARAMLAADPDNRTARTTLADLLHAQGDIGGEIDHRVALALAPAADAPPLLALRDLHDAAGLILCRPLTPQARAQLDALLAAARALDVPAPAGTDWEAWAMHYRVLIEALDMDLALRPPPVRRDAARLEMISATGEALDWKRLRARADELGAEAVFFAAADEAYVDLYARWYALSVSRYADVPFLTVIHVIGGKGQLKRIAKAVGVADERLVFTADAFDAGAVTTKCYDAPPKGLIDKPVAHLQCSRFQRLGALLDRIERPVFVSDIDLILQRGVADLLAAQAHVDLVLNENELTFNAGSRLTANLLLVNPTQHGKGFVAALAAYLDAMLARPTVTRWIDQVGLTLARQNLLANAPAAKIGYFDTRSDINNVMYPSFQEHPFRFLSLFHGFDTSSLERDPRVLGEAQG
jgi:thioredoxin-like negative regulator of GroEL